MVAKLRLCRRSAAGRSCRDACTRRKRPVGATPIDYNRDIRPILSNHCYACHGPDQAKRQAGLRLDQRGDGPGGARIGRPRDRAGQQRREQTDRPRHVDRRRRAHAAARRPASGSSPREIETLRRWIDQGAEWKGHWSYLQGRAAAAAAGQRSGLAAERRSTISSCSGSTSEGLKPSPEADKADADSPRELRPDRPAADDRRGRRLPGRHQRRRLRARRRSAAGFAPLRRADGA